VTAVREEAARHERREPLELVAPVGPVEPAAIATHAGGQAPLHQRLRRGRSLLRRGHQCAAHRRLAVQPRRRLRGDRPLRQGWRDRDQPGHPLRRAGRVATCPARSAHANAGATLGGGPVQRVEHAALFPKSGNRQQTGARIPRPLRIAARAKFPPRRWKSGLIASPTIGRYAARPGCVVGYDGCRIGVGRRE
jgi:hypothetical protein